MTTKKPADLFDRNVEWANLSQFASDSAPELRLGVVWGRRRQGKSFLLQAFAEATGGFYYEAFAGTSAELLADLGSKIGSYLGLGTPIRLSTWDDAIEVLISLGTRGDGNPIRSTLVVLDEFPYLAAAAPALPSLIARTLAARGSRRKSSRVRLILCGSALRFMVGLLGGSAPLRGRAGLEQVIGAFDFRAAREYWGLSDPRLAMLTYAVVGGTPAYKKEFLRDDVPRSPRDFDAWVVRTALNSASSLFREGRVLVEEEPHITELALYHSVLAAIASGDHKPSSIAGRVGRPLSALPHVLSVLSDSGIIERHVDTFRSNRTTYEITEPIVAFHHAIMRPTWAALERGRAASAWASAKPTFLSRLVGPTFERACRDWTRMFASAKTRGGRDTHVGHGAVADPGGKTLHEVDIVVFEGKRLCAIGEAKWSEPLSTAAVARLERIRSLLGARGWDVSKCRLLYFTGNASARARGTTTVDVVDAERLYEGD